MEPKEDFSNLTFRQGMAELDAVVKKLESNTLELEDSLKAYERGVALLRELSSRLSSAQQQVDDLMGELSGQMEDSARDKTLS